jgi:hypothetical protein
VDVRGPPQAAPARRRAGRLRPLACFDVARAATPAPPLARRVVGAAWNAIRARNAAPKPCPRLPVVDALVVLRGSRACVAAAVEVAAWWRRLRRGGVQEATGHGGLEETSCLARLFVFFLFSDPRTLTGCSARSEARSRGLSLKSCIKLSSTIIGFGLGGFVAFDFNRDIFLCIFFWIHNACGSQRGTFSLVDLE